MTFFSCFNASFKLGLAVALCAAGSALAQADSVGNAQRRGSLGISLGGGGQAAADNGGFTSLMSAQSMVSTEKVSGGRQSETSFGPFTNSSRNALNITLSTRYESFVGVAVNGVMVGTSPFNVTAVVPPGAEYTLFAADGAMITAWVNAAEATTASVGLPTAADFGSPRFTSAVFDHCTDFADIVSSGDSGDQYWYIGTGYYYRVTRSDNSHVRSRYGDDYGPMGAVAVIANDLWLGPRNSGCAPLPPDSTTPPPSTRNWTPIFSWW